MKFAMKVRNLSGRKVALDWLESGYDLKPDEDTMVDMKDTLLFRKGQKADQAREKLQFQRSKGLVDIVVVTDQLTQNIVDEDEVSAPRPRKRAAAESPSTAQKLAEQKLSQAQEGTDPSGRFKMTKAEDAEGADRLSPTPGTGRAQDQKVLDATDKSLYEAHQEQQMRDTRDQAVQQAQKQQTKSSTSKSAEDTKASAESSTASSKSSSSTKSTKSTGTKSSKSTKSTGTKSSKSTKSTKSTESDDSETSTGDSE